MGLYQLFRQYLWLPCSISLHKELSSLRVRPESSLKVRPTLRGFLVYYFYHSQYDVPCPPSSINLLSSWPTISSTYDIFLDFEGYGPCATNAKMVLTDFFVRESPLRDKGRRNSLHPYVDIEILMRPKFHKIVITLLRTGDLDAAYSYAHTCFGILRVGTCNAIIVAMINAKRYNDAICLFQHLFQISDADRPTVASFNLLLKAYLDAGRVEMGYVVYNHVLNNLRCAHSTVIYRVLTKGLIEKGRVYDALDILRDMLRYGGEVDSIVYNNVIKGFLDIDDIGKANGLFEELKGKCAQYDGVLHATFMDWFFKKGQAKEGMEMYQSLLDRGISKMNPNTGNILLSVLLKHGKESEAWKLFDQMLGNHIPPIFHAVNSNSYNIMVNECFKSGKYSEAIQVFRMIGKQQGSKPFAMDISGYNNIITNLCENNLLVEAETLFEELISSTKSLSPDAITYRTLIEAYFREDRTDDAFRLFTKMVKSKLWVTTTFGSKVFNELVKNKKVEMAFEMLKIMHEHESDLTPHPMIYEIVTLGLFYENILDKCRTLVIKMVDRGVGVSSTLMKFLPQIFGKARWNEDKDLRKRMTRLVPRKELKAQDIIRKLEERVENMERKYVKIRAHMKAMKSTSSKSRLKR